MDNRKKAVRAKCSAPHYWARGELSSLRVHYYFKRADRSLSSPFNEKLSSVWNLIMTVILFSPSVWKTMKAFQIFKIEDQENVAFQKLNKQTSSIQLT